MTKGQALVSGVAINAPVLIRVRERLTTHGGMSKNAPIEWLSWIEKTMKSEEKVKIVSEKPRFFWE